MHAATQYGGAIATNPHRLWTSLRTVLREARAEPSAARPARIMAKKWPAKMFDRKTLFGMPREHVRELHA